MSYLQSNEVGTSTSGGSSDITVSTPAIMTLAMPTSGTEYTLTLPTNTKRFLIRSRLYGYIKLRVISGSTEYLSITPGNSHEEMNLLLTSSLVFYLVSSKTSDVLEVLYWT